MMREGMDFRARGAEAAGTAEGGQADIVQRIAAVVGEIDALRRERHEAPVFGARARLASTYFIKRAPKHDG
ncbi:MAG: hypothetical protein K0S06_1789 [Microvirga sp.]|jgi:hypothetical protein|nr:hypothetical protein [Microvirga sp.]